MSRCRSWYKSRLRNTSTESFYKVSTLRRVRDRSATRNKRGAWLSLFAMLMIFIGPLVSQSMPMDHHVGMSMSMPASMDMSADSHAHHGGEHSMPADAGMSDHALWAKCGYCTLLFSCPALPHVLELVAAPPPRPGDFFASQPLPGHAHKAIFPNARSRAPPALTTA
ncbi:Uncharacterized protein ALO61_00038 [Pseudomonas savastanoi pv. nerii]|uniref:Multicopper oxidase n=3 Tax=Pseudomonas syringae group genomosp. 2 TaxID=251698 RepID=A0A0P9VXU4_PSESS|nr:putative multicopper oxidase [Pseudomonas amygdali pv. ciccaronei]KPX98246.1 Uncharacterized protein ALO62_02996 [Pseudomonas amygdali pv. myricae]KPY09077.1 Uncharacterized protein ALO61_00038 [Pseudomonas savastanoi pv. nerii]KPY48987.1 putative multicopper oxidase [Pseudomonas syringae pv. rhaphiolepidis]KPY75577.1 Uncharacterized protein ALO58_02976 [Pseudomonas savastanoi pv. savastanoi]KUG41777.1 Uncharacterized protein ALP79_00391 [Pseudomonas savastanoi pv. fraxini]RML95310.1 hypot